MFGDCTNIINKTQELFMSVKHYISVICILVTSLVNAAPAAHNTEEIQHIKSLLQQMIDVNLRFKDKFHDIMSHSTLEQQTPHATVVMCSDSRVDMDILTDTPTGEMFVIRNIGNQLSTAYGSVEYGVDHLKTQLLLIVGHSGCGAVKTAMQDYSRESVHLKAELDNIKINPKDSLNNNLIKNVSNQVKVAADTFKTKMQSGEVVIIGMIYDMHNDFGMGNGQLILVNINNVTDSKSLLKNEYVKGLTNLKFMQN